MVDEAENEKTGEPAGSERRAALRSDMPGGGSTRLRDSGFPMRKASTLPDISAYTGSIGSIPGNRSDEPQLHSGRTADVTTDSATPATEQIAATPFVGSDSEPGTGGGTSDAHDSAGYLHDEDATDAHDVVAAHDTAAHDADAYDAGTRGTDGPERADDIEADDAGTPGRAGDADDLDGDTRNPEAHDTDAPDRASASETHNPERHDPDTRNPEPHDPGTHDTDASDRASASETHNPEPHDPETHDNDSGHTGPRTTRTSTTRTSTTRASTTRMRTTAAGAVGHGSTRARTAGDDPAPDTSSLTIRPPEEDVSRRANQRDEAAAAKPILPRVLQVVVAAIFPVILLGAAVRAVTTPLFLWAEYHRPGFPADSYGFTTEDRMTYGSYAMDYILNWAPARYLGDLVNPDGDQLFLESEVGHMADVKAVLSTGFVVATVLALLAVAACVYLARRYPGGVRRALFAGAVATLVLAVALAVAGVLAWEAFFTQVHALFFADGTWTFRLDDTLIRLFPAQFWIDAAAVVGTIVLLGSVLTLVLTWPTRARREKSANAYAKRRAAALLHD